jgi:hypothetical protein
MSIIHKFEIKTFNFLELQRRKRKQKLEANDLPIFKSY